MKSKLIELEDRNPIVIEKRYEIHTNGNDNAYPTRIERLINASPTAKSCAKTMAKFIIGSGFNVILPDDTFVGETNEGKVTPYDLLKESAHMLARQNAFAFHVNYDITFRKTSITPIDYKQLRYGLPDSKGYKGKIVLYDNWDLVKKRYVKQTEFQVFDVFNDNPIVIAEQIKAAGGIFKYRGQILIVKNDIGIYPLSPLDPAQDDADTEYQLQLYKNRTTRKGFVGKKIITTEPFDDAEDEEAFHKDLKDIQGFNSKGDILHSVTKFSSDNKRDAIQVVNLDADIKTDLFANWENSLSDSLRRCYNNLPKILYELETAGLGTSGESLKMAQAYYNSQTSEERKLISKVLKNLFKNFHIAVNPTNDWTIAQLNLLQDGTTNQ